MSRSFRCPTFMVLLIPLVFALPAAAAAGTTVVSADNWGAWQDRRSTAPVESLRVDNIVLDASQSGRSIVLERVDVFTADSRIRVNGEWLESDRPERAYYRGSLVDDPGSIATLSIGEAGDFRGLLSSADGYWMFGNGEADRDGSLKLIALHQSEAPETHGFGAPQQEGFQCQLDGHVRDVSELSRVLGTSAGSWPDSELQGTPQRYRVRVAFESDFSFFQIFQGQGNPDQAARDYLGDLVNYISGIYIANLNTEMQISSVSLWNSAASQPWQNLGNTGCLLNEMGIYWNNPNNAVDATRTLAHFVTGNSTGQAGVAWLGALCANPQNLDTGTQCNGFAGVQNAFGDYGVSAGLDGTFDANTQPTVWDYVVVAHELGHNFNSDHTHCYNTVNVPGFASTVIDQCHNGEQGNGCWNGPETLPGLPGQGSGTIMSYCHLLDPGLANIAPTLGLNHPFGDSPQRVPTVMRAHVLAAAANNLPRCPQPVDGTPPPPAPICSVVGQPIPDNNATGLANTLVVGNAASIGKLEVLLDIDHSWVGDLIVDLEHVGTSTTVRLVNRAGVSGANPFGCSGSDIKVTLDDQATPAIQDDCQSQQGQPAFPAQRYRPANALTAYNGLSLNGNWTLRVSDNAQGDTGQLVRWCLVPTTAGAADLIFANGFQ